MAATLRFAGPQDAAAIQAIYAPIVRDTPTSFEVDVPTIEEMRARMTETLEQYPWLVVERGDEVLGYAYASRHRKRPAYQWSVDVSVYVNEQVRRAGVGRALYTALLEILRLQGFRNAYAGIALPNLGSVGLHEALGFKAVGVYRGVGYKHGRWHDVGWWELELRTDSEPPRPPRSPADLSGPEVREGLAAGMRFLLA